MPLTFMSRIISPGERKIQWFVDAEPLASACCLQNILARDPQLIELAIGKGTQLDAGTALLT
jgi:hypothetical protein